MSLAVEAIRSIPPELDARVILTRASSGDQVSLRTLHSLCMRAACTYFDLEDGFIPATHQARHISRLVTMQLSRCSANALGRALGRHHGNVMMSVHKADGCPHVEHVARLAIDLLKHYRCAALPEWAAIALDRGWTPPEGWSP